MQMLVRECELFHTGKMNLSATSPTLANKLDARGGVNMKQHEAVASGPRPLYQLCAPQAPSLAHSRRIPAQVGTVDSTRTFVFRSIGHRRGKASTSSLPRLTGWRCRAGKRRGAEPRAKLRGPGIVALLVKGLLGVAAMVRLHDRAMRQRCRLPVVIWTLDAVSADA